MNILHYHMLKWAPIQRIFITITSSNSDFINIFEQQLLYIYPYHKNPLLLQTYSYARNALPEGYLLPIQDELLKFLS